MFFVGLLVFLSASERVTGRLLCSENSDTTLQISGSTIKLVKDERVHYTALEIDNLQIGATVCFDLTTPKGEVKMYAIKLKKVSSSVGFEDQYDFGVPNVTAKCTCSCSDKASILEECDAVKQGFCEGYSVNGRCVTTKEATQVSKGCTKLMQDADLCCAIRMRKSDIDKRFKAFKVRDNPHTYNTVELYTSYMGTDPQPHLIDNLDGTQLIKEDDIIFEEITATIESSDISIVDSSSWYIGVSEPYNETVYETKEKVNLKNEYELSKVGWAKYQDGTYKVGEDTISEDKILKAFSPTVNDCRDSEITTKFHSTNIADFKNSLVELQSIHSTYVDEVSWEPIGGENHAKVTWNYKDSAHKIDLKLKLKGKESEFEVVRISHETELGEFEAEVRVSQHGEAYIEIKLTDTRGNIYAEYKIEGEDPFPFTLDVPDEKSVTLRKTHPNLQCKKNAAGELCLSTNKKKKCRTVKCTEDRIEDSEIKESEIDTETVKSDDPMNWRSWLKYANPLEWFNGISTTQEAIMLVVELLGMFGGLFLVLKILRMLNLLGKCCRCMFCCFLCPKTEEKIRKRASTMRENHQRRWTETKRRMTARSRRFTASFKRKNRVSSDGSEGERRKVLKRDRSFKESFRQRLTTAAAVQYLRRKIKGEPDPEGKEAKNEYELEGGLLPVMEQEHENHEDGGSRKEEEEKGHVNGVCEVEDEKQDETKKPATKTVSFN